MSIRSNDCTQISIEANEPHGEFIFDILTTCAPTGTTFAFYRVLEAGDVVDAGNLITALSRMIEDNVDIVNLSVGLPRKRGVNRKYLRRAVKDTLDHNIPIIAAAGNREQINPDEGHYDSVFYPARITGVISVGGYESICKQNENCDQVSYSFGGDGPFCGKHKYLDARCRGVDTDEWWKGNVLPTINNPTITAPVHYVCKVKRPSGIGSREILLKGTSYAAPLVTGQLAGILCELKYQPTPDQILDSVKSAANSEEFPKFDALRTLVRLRNS